MYKYFSKFLMSSCLTLLVAGAALAQTHEYGTLKREKIDYRDWTYQTLDGQAVNLRELSQRNGAKLMLVVYFADWCPNWKLEMPVAKQLYDKYHPYGLDVVGVVEYSLLDGVRKSVKENPLPFPVVYESDSPEKRTQTTHYTYRQQTGDTRKWGSPYNVFFVPKDTKPQGEVLTDKTWIAGGELHEEEAEKLIRKQLKLKS